jgi:hypothetical protein
VSATAKLLDQKGPPCRITLDGTKIPLGLVEGATENVTVVRDLLAGCGIAGWIPPDRSWLS